MHLRDLNEHIKADHEGQRFFCDMCEHSAKIKNDIKKHKETQHSLEPRKKYSCTHCPKVYLILKNLKVHTARKHEQRQITFKCDKCPFSTLFEKFLRPHYLPHEFSGSQQCRLYITPNYYLNTLLVIFCIL